MLKYILIFYLVAIALPSVISLITFNYLNRFFLFTTLSLNIISLNLMIFYIQSIGWNILTFSLTFIFFNNIFISLFRFIIDFHYFNNNLKEYLIKLLSLYIKIIYIFPNYILRNILTTINEVLNIFNNRVNNTLYNFLIVEPLNLINKEYNEENKNIILTFENNKLLDHKNLFAALFIGLSSQEEFSKPGKKIMIVSISNEDKTFYVHKNIIIDENTTIFSYLEKIKNNIQLFYDSGYPIHIFNILQVRIWDYELPIKGSKSNSKNSIYKFRRGFHTSCVINKNENLIKPLKTPKNINKMLIATIDIETIDLNNNQYPISLSFSYYSNNELITIFELIDYNLFRNKPDEAVKILWLNLMNKLNNLKLHRCVIFSHNLGSFDGYFLFKGLLELPDINIDNVTSIIDELHRFISIQVIWKDSKFIFKDSLRIFPVSLQELCNLFNVEGKLHPYNPKFNKISLFENKTLLNQFIEYSTQDSISLLNALTEAQIIYIKEYKVDIATIWSTSTLSLKIFRQNFLVNNIPILTNKLDSLIRLGYIGGSTDYFYKYGENLKHYDVNSLYPKAMMNPMPIEFLEELDGSNIKLEDVFGFAEARITTPDNIEIPLLPYKVDNETLHPTGSWIGVYFTEELKTVMKYGYKVELIKVYNFSKDNIFNDYITHFYNIKKNAVGSLRFIAKMHLNQLYGYFGRKKTLIETRNVYKHELKDFYGFYTIFAEIDINKNISTILMSTNLDYDLINEIKDNTKLELITNFRNVKSHVGIAAAVTSYARIEMMELKMLLLKLGIKLYYTDTDSFFTDKELPAYLIGKDLGQLKDELKGSIIKKAYFLGIKKYGYIDDNNKTHSVFSGIERDSLTWNEIENIANGFTVVKTSSVKFFKSFNNLNITIKKDLKTSIEFNTRKSINNNKYLPIKINVKIFVKINYYLKVIINKIIHIINKYNLNKIK